MGYMTFILGIYFGNHQYKRFYIVKSKCRELWNILRDCKIHPKRNSILIVFFNPLTFATRLLDF